MVDAAPADVAPDLQSLLATQRRDYDRAPFPAWPVRRDRLARLKGLIEGNERAIAAAINADFNGRSFTETELLELFPTLAELNAALRHGERWMRPRRAAVSKWFLPARARVMPRPLGVVGVIAPWNYPLFLSAGPLAGVLAAGNRALLKLSEFTPVFSALLRDLVAQTFAPEELAVITGGADVAAAFSALPFDHLVFTGSTAVGRKVMAAASRNLTPVTLELGGKSPVVIAPGYALAHAVERVLAGKLMNAGQTCIAPDYVLLPRAALDHFIELSIARVRSMFPQGLLEADYTSIVNERQYQRLIAYLDAVQAGGTHVVPLFDGAQCDASAHRLAPMLVINPPVTSPLMQDEIFGPLLPLLPYDNLSDAVAFVRARAHPLALYWFDRDQDRVQWALQHVHAGAVCINETILHIAQDELPFGGVGASGMGHYHGRWGFDTFSKLMPVFQQARFNGIGLFNPPYKPYVSKLRKLMNRF